MMHRKIILWLFGFLVLGAFAVMVVSTTASPFNPKDPSLEKLGRIQARGTIIIGTDATYPPLESINENGTFVGLDMDVAREIARDLGVEPEFKNIAWDRIFDDLKNGEVDFVISSITITKERTESFAFSDPYLNAGQVIVSTTSAATRLKGPEDLKDARVGVQPDTTSAKEARKYVADSAQVISYNDYSVAKEDMIAGKLDALVIDYPAAAALVANDPRLAITSGIFTQEFYGIAANKRDTELVAQINKTIRRLKQEGALRSLEQRWLGQ